MTAPFPEVDGLELRRVIGRGGSAIIYEGHDARHGRQVAVKIVHADDLTQSQRRAFTRELVAMGRLGDHPHVVPVYDSGFAADGSPYLVMPLFADGTMSARVRVGGALSVEEVLSVGIKIAAALETAHRRGILHCDIKPNNVLIDSWGEPQLADFGISSVRESGVTSTNASSMTLMYAAPEIIEDQHPTVSSDLYSLGATLFALIEGRKPYSAKSPAALVRAIISAPAAPEPKVEMPDGLRQLFAELMNRDPSKRPPTAAALIERFQKIQTELGLDVTTVVIGEIDSDATAALAATRFDNLESQDAHPDAVSGSWLARPQSRILGALALVAVVGLVVGLVLVLVLNRSDGDPQIADGASTPVETPSPAAAASTAAATASSPTTPPESTPTSTASTTGLGLLRSDNAPPLAEPTVAHAGGAYTVDWSTRGLLATGGHDGVVRLWNESGELLNELGHEAPVLDVAWSPDGSLLAVADDAEIRVWDLETGDDRRFRSSVGQREVAWSPDGSILASGAWGQVSVWDPIQGVATAEHQFGEATAWSVDITNDGTVATLTSEGRLLTWGPEPRAEPNDLGLWIDVDDSYDTTVRFLGDGNLLIGAVDDEIRISDPTGELVRSFADEWHPLALDVSPDQQLMLSVGQVSTVRIFDLETGAILGRLSVGYTSVSSTSWSPDGQRAAVADYDGEVRIWDLSDPTEPVMTNTLDG